MPDMLSNVLKVNQPINNGFDNNSVKNNPIVPGDTQIRNIVDPSKVMRTDGKEETDDKRFAFSAESNYGTFLQSLKGMPGLEELFSKLFIMDYQTLISTGIGESFAEQIASFMEMIKMDGGELLSFITGQAASAGKFKGPFFQALREVLNGTASVELRAGILEFLKKYSDMSSSDHLLKNILIEMGEMKPLMFQTDVEELEQLAARLKFTEDGDTSAPGGRQNTGLEGEKLPLAERMSQTIQENSRLLKEEILPFFSKYITKTHDLGKVRDIMTLITLNISRYVNGDKENLMQSFEKLFQFGDFRQRLGEIKEGNLDVILNRMLTEQRSSEKNVWTEKFVDLLRSGLNGEGGYESKVVFQNILNAMLLNESVYMPLLHVMLPVNLNGNLMFSEMWVDPDASGGQAVDEKEKSIRMLVKFDVKSLGYFEVVLNYQAGNVDMLVMYPPKLLSQEKNIRNGLSQLVSENGLSIQSLTVEQGRMPLSLTDVFPKIKEGRNSVDVRV